MGNRTVKMRYKEKEFTSTTFNLFIILMFSLPILAITHNALTTLSTFADYGHDVISTFLTHVVNYSSVYAVISISILGYSWVHACQLRTRKHLGKEWKALLEHWQKKTSQKTLENAALLQRYEGIKKTISETVSPCGQLIFNADDSISLQHLYCKDYRKQEKTIADLKKELFVMNKENHKLRHKAPLIVPTPEYLATIKSQEIFERDGRLERAAAEAMCRTHQIRILSTDLKDSNNLNETLKKTEHQTKKQLSILKARNKALEASQNSQAQATIERLESELANNKAALIDSGKELDEIMSQYEDLVSEREGMLKSQSALQSQVLDLQKTLKVKASEVELEKQSAKDGIETARTKNQTVIAGLRNEVTALQASLHKSTQDNIANDQERESVNAELQAALDEIKHQYMQETAAKQKLQATLDKTRQQYTKEVAGKNSEIEALRARVITNADIRGSAEYQDVLTRGENLERERRQLEAEVVQLKSVLQQSPTAEAIQTAIDNYAQLESSYNEEVDKVTAKDIELEVKEKQLRTKDQTIADNERTMRHLEQTIKNKDAIIADLFKRPANSTLIDNEKPLLNDPTTDLEILKGVVAGKDARITRLMREVQAAQDEEREAKEEAYQAKASAQRADGERERLTDLIALENGLEAWLNSKQVGWKSYPTLTRITRSFESNGIVFDTASAITQILDDKNIRTTDPATGLTFDLEPRVEFLANEYVRLSETANNATFAIDPQLLQQPAIPPPLPESDDEKTQILDEILYYLNLWSISDPTFTLLDRVKFAMHSTLDAKNTMQLIHDWKLANPNAAATCEEQVKSALGFLYWYKNTYEIIDAELSKKYGQRTHGDNSDTCLGRVKKLMALPHNRKGAIKDY